MLFRSAYSVQALPRWNPINVCSYHLQEAGATPVQEIAYALANAIAVLDLVAARDDVPAEVLPRVVGMSNASDLLLSGRAVTGIEAAAIGLVSAALPADEVLDAAIERADVMARLSAPVSMAVSKRLLWQSMGIDEMQALEDPLFAWIAEQPDSVEGVASFLDKRNPRWNLSAERDFPHHLFP